MLPGKAMSRVRCTTGIGSLEAENQFAKGNQTPQSVDKPSLLVTSHMCNDVAHVGPNIPDIKYINRACAICVGCYKHASDFICLVFPHPAFHGSG
jgi:hypothetical protein